MRLFSILQRLLPQRPVRLKLRDWFVVTFNETRVRIKAAPPDSEAWEQEFTWASIVRICFKAENLYVSDGIYVFTTQRPESYVIPTEARGGEELWAEIIRRKLFDAALAGEAITAAEGIFCWPADEQRSE